MPRLTRFEQRSVGRRQLLALDQVIYSGTNFFATAIAALVLSPPEVGAVAISSAVFSLCTAVTRSLILQPRQAFQEISHDATCRSAGDTLVVSLALALFGSLINLALFSGAPTTVPVSLVLLALPLGATHDVVRALSVALDRAEPVLVTDVVWAVTQVGTMAVFALIGVGLSATSLTAAWAAGSIAAAIVMFHSYPPAIGPLSLHRSYRSLLVDNLLGQASVNTFPFLVAAGGGVALAGQVQTARVAFRPLNVAFNAISTFALPYLRSESGGNTFARSNLLMRQLVLGVVVYSGVAIPFSLLAFDTPDLLAMSALIAVESAFFAVHLVSIFALRVRARSRPVVASRIVMAAIGTTGVFVAAESGSAVVVCLVLALGTACGAGLAHVSLRSTRRRGQLG